MTRTRLNRAWRVLSAPWLLILPVSLSGCAIAHLGNPFHTSSSANTPAPISQTALLANAKADNGSDPALAFGEDTNCPRVVSWPQDRLITVYQRGHQGDQMAIVHRGEITKLARQCNLVGDTMTVKYGFAGRVLLGPKGRPGVVTLPVEIRVANADHKVIKVDKLRVATTIQPGSPVAYFSMVRMVSFPIAIGTRPQDYQIYVGLKQSLAGSG